eukprot:994743_1
MRKRRKHMEGQQLYDQKDSSQQKEKTRKCAVELQMHGQRKEKEEDHRTGTYIVCICVLYIIIGNDNVKQKHLSEIQCVPAHCPGNCINKHTRVVIKIIICKTRTQLLSFPSVDYCLFGRITVVLP